MYCGGGRLTPGAPACSQRHYANMLLAMHNRAKAQRIIPRHHSEGMPVPHVIHDDEPEPWSTTGFPNSYDTDSDGDGILDNRDPNPYGAR